MIPEGQEIFMAMPAFLVPVAMWAGRAVVSHVVRRGAITGAVQTVRRLTSRPYRRFYKLVLAQQLGFQILRSPTKVHHNVNWAFDRSLALYDYLGYMGLRHQGQSTGSNKYNRHKRNPRKSPAGVGNGAVKAKRKNRPAGIKLRSSLHGIGN